MSMGQNSFDNFSTGEAKKELNSHWDTHCDICYRSCEMECSDDEFRPISLVTILYQHINTCSKINIIRLSSFFFTEQLFFIFKKLIMSICENITHSDLRNHSARVASKCRKILKMTSYHQNIYRLISN